MTDTMQKEYTMKHLYRISISIIACGVIGSLIYFLVGEFHNEVGDLGDYPQIYANEREMEYEQQLRAQEARSGAVQSDNGINDSENAEVSTGILGELGNGEDDASETILVKPEFVTRQTVYILEEYDSYEGTLTSSEAELPRQYLGMTREELETELSIYAGAPSLEDVAKGLTGVILESFSEERITVRKIYYKEPEPECYLLTAEDHYVVVYYRNLQTLYCYTNIRVEDLPVEVQEEIMQIKRLDTPEELFAFLESYSS